MRNKQRNSKGRTCVALRLLRGLVFQRKRLVANNSGLHPALIGVIVVIAITAVLFSGARVGFFGFLNTSKDLQAQETLKNVLTFAQQYWHETGNAQKDADWGFFAQEGASKKFESDEIVAHREVARIRYVECSLAKVLASNDPNMTFYFMDALAPETPSFVPSSNLISDHFNHESVAVNSTASKDGFDGFNPFALTEVTRDTNCEQGPDSSPYEVGVSGFPTWSGGGQVGSVNYISSISQVSDILTGPNNVWVDIHYGAEGSEKSNSPKKRDLVLGIEKAGESEIPPGVTVIIGNSSTEGNTFCIRQVYDGQYSGEYYQSISKKWTDSWGQAGSDREFSINAIASCQVLPGSNVFTTQYNYTEGGFPAPFSG